MGEGFSILEAAATLRFASRLKASHFHFANVQFWENLSTYVASVTSGGLTRGSIFFLFFFLGEEAGTFRRFEGVAAPDTSSEDELNEDGLA